MEELVFNGVGAGAMVRLDGSVLAGHGLDAVSSSLDYPAYSEFAVNALDEIRGLAQALSQVCPRPQMAVIGLSELMINAHEHGNLGISYDEKGALMEAGRWQEEILLREKLPENLTKLVRVTFERLPGCVRFIIRDQGNGFDWPRFMHPSLKGVFDSHGRGIAISRAMCFSRVVYVGNGNTVVAEMDVDGDEEER